MERKMEERGRAKESRGVREDGKTTGWREKKWEKEEAEIN